MKSAWIPSPVLLLLAMAVVSCAGCSSINKAYWDHQVDELCEKDGGVTIYEKVVISKKDYPDLKLTPSGELIIPDERFATDKDYFYSTFHSEYLKKGSPDIIKFESKIFRRHDKKLLRKSISFARRGGDSILFSWVHPSSYSCSKEIFNEEINMVILVKED